MTFDPSRIFQTLDRHGVDYLTIGAWAVIAHGYVRATADIDFVARLDEQNMERLDPEYPHEMGISLGAASGI